MTTTMKLSELKKAEQVLAEELRDPEFRAEWERTALARALANQVIAYRVEHGLSQRGLAELLGVKQPHVARLERGEKNPTIETLVRLSHRLGIELALDIHPPGREPKLVTKRARASAALASDPADNIGLVLAVA